jgi:hypothetical protein
VSFIASSSDAAVQSDDARDARQAGPALGSR